MYINNYFFSNIFYLKTLVLVYFSNFDTKTLFSEVFHILNYNYFFMFLK